MPARVGRSLGHNLGFPLGFTPGENALWPDPFANDGIHLDFVSGQHYIKAPGADPTVAPFTSLFTFTGDNLSKYRAQSGLLVPSVTNTPRIEYDVNGNVLGLLMEGSRQNLCLQSETFTTTWTTTGIGSFSKTTTAPDGTTNGTIMTEDAAAGSAHNITQTIASGANVTVSYTVWVKRGAGTRHVSLLLLGTGGANFIRQGYNLTTNAIGTTAITGDASLVSASMTSYGNGWFRLTLTAIPSATVTLASLRVEMASDAANTVVYNGDGASQIFVYGAQLETPASFPSSYIPTTTVAVTRAADSAIRTLGAEFIQAPGSYVAEVFEAAPNDVFETIFSFVDGVTNTTFSRLRLQQASATGFIRANHQVQDASVLQSDLLSPQVARTGPFKTAHAWSTNDVVAYTIGVQDGTDVVATMGAGRTQLRIEGGAFFNEVSYIRRLDYYPTRLPNAILQALTA